MYSSGGYLVEEKSASHRLATVVPLPERRVKEAEPFQHGTREQEPLDGTGENARVTRPMALGPEETLEKKHKWKRNIAALCLLHSDCRPEFTPFSLSLSLSLFVSLARTPALGRV